MNLPAVVLGKGTRQTEVRCVLRAEKSGVDFK